MVKILIHPQIYIILGILLFPILIVIVYCINALIKKIRESRKNSSLAQKTSINQVVQSGNIEEEYEIDTIIHTIKKDIEELREEIESSKKIWEGEKVNQEKQEVIIREGESLGKEQVKIMNENISKFIRICRERDVIIKNQKYTIEEKNKAIIQFQQKIQEVEHKYKRAILLYKNTTEKEQIKKNIIGEKNIHINNLQYKLNDIEKRYNDAIDNKEQMRENEILTREKNKNRMLSILLMSLLIMGIFILIFSGYIQEIIIYTT